jgi:hypothetical protein
MVIFFIVFFFRFCLSVFGFGFGFFVGDLLGKVGIALCEIPGRGAEDNCPRLRARINRNSEGFKCEFSWNCNYRLRELGLRTMTLHHSDEAECADGKQANDSNKHGFFHIGVWVYVEVQTKTEHHAPQLYEL